MELPLARELTNRWSVALLAFLSALFTVYANRDQPFVRPESVSLVAGALLGVAVPTRVPRVVVAGCLAFALVGLLSLGSRSFLASGVPHLVNAAEVMVGFLLSSIRVRRDRVVGVVALVSAAASVCISWLVMLCWPLQDVATNLSIVGFAGRDIVVGSAVMLLSAFGTRPRWQLVVCGLYLLRAGPTPAYQLARNYQVDPGVEIASVAVSCVLLLGVGRLCCGGTTWSVSSWCGVLPRRGRLLALSLIAMAGAGYWFAREATRPWPMFPDAHLRTWAFLAFLTPPIVYGQALAGRRVWTQLAGLGAIAPAMGIGALAGATVSMMRLHPSALAADIFDGTFLVVLAVVIVPSVLAASVLHRVSVPAWCVVVANTGAGAMSYRFARHLGAPLEVATWDGPGFIATSVLLAAALLAIVGSRLPSRRVLLLILLSWAPWGAIAVWRVNETERLYPFREVFDVGTDATLSYWALSIAPTVLAIWCVGLLVKSVREVQRVADLEFSRSSELAS